MENIGKILICTLSIFIIGAVLLSRANINVEKSVKRSRWKKLLVYLIITHVTIICIVVGFFSLLVTIIIILGFYELASLYFKSPRAVTVRTFLLSLTIYTFFCHGLFSFSHQCSITQALFVYIIVFSFDGFSQLSGHMLGRTQLAPRLSPGKTMEGFAGGMLASLIITTSLKDMLEITWFGSLLWGSSIGITALCGDLLASFYKRITGFKDFGQLLPEHGGILDRFDSLFMPCGLTWLYTLQIKAEIVS